MEQQNFTEQPSKHIKSFWAIVVIFVVAFIAGGLVYWFQFQFSYDEEINSIEIRLQKRAHEQKPAENEQGMLPPTSTAPIQPE